MLETKYCRLLAAKDYQDHWSQMQSFPGWVVIDFLFISHSELSQAILRNTDHMQESHVVLFKLLHQ